VGTEKTRSWAITFSQNFNVIAPGNGSITGLNHGNWQQEEFLHALLVEDWGLSLYLRIMLKRQ
jgi:hypothetical protein